jgi:hypothetical protein
MKMTPLRKQAFAWLAVLTAIAVSALAGNFIYLSEKIPTDPAYIETRTTQVALSRGFDIDGAKKAGYLEQEIASYLVKANLAEFNRQWYRVLIFVCSIYFVLALGIFATILRKEAKP